MANRRRNPTCPRCGGTTANARMGQDKIYYTCTTTGCRSTVVQGKQGVYADGPTLKEWRGY